MKDAPGSHGDRINEVIPDQREREEFLRHVYEKGNDAIIVFDPEGTVKLLNSAAERLFDIPAEHMVGRLFQFRAFTDKPREVEIVRSGKDTRIADLQTTEIQLPSGRLFVSSLHDVTELVRLRDELRAVAFVDNLTGLCNHAAFLILAEQQIKIASRTRKWLLFLLTTVDHMQWIHDAMGRHQAEQALIDTASILKQTFRNSDIIARIGDNEFAVLAIEAHYSSSHIVTARLYEHIEGYNVKQKKLYGLSLTLGTSFYDPDHPCSLDDLLARACATML